MVELIVGKKGKGKTKVLLDRVNGAVKEANGSIVYLDKSTKHMYELNNKVRLIDVSSYPVMLPESLLCQAKYLQLLKFRISHRSCPADQVYL